MVELRLTGASLVKIRVMKNEVRIYPCVHKRATS